MTIEGLFSVWEEDKEDGHACNTDIGLDIDLFKLYIPKKIN